MKAAIIDGLERYELSAARRYFVVAEMRARAERLKKSELVAEMSEYLAWLGEFIGEGRARLAYWQPQERSEGEEEGDLLLLLLIGRVMRECTEHEQEEVLFPLMQQLTRLEDYARSEEVGSPM